MECNRDEAKRAKEIAESKFCTKDIMGAKKFALKAQSLYPGLDGLPQLLAVLDVYVAAENKINGQLDFYGILGVSPSADDDTVKRHYRKLALSLHPDKNKSIGAEGAFQYVSEAWNLLSDKEKRSTYDKRNSRVFKHRVKAQNGGSRASQPPMQNGFYNFMNPTSPQTTAKVSTAKAKGTAKSPKDSPSKTVPTSVPASSNKQTFWTVCKRCKLQYEYVRMYLNRNLLCPTCHGPFLAIEIPPPNTNSCSEALKAAQSNPGTRHAWGPFLRNTSPATVAQAASMVQQAYERVKRDREAQATTKREDAKKRKMSNKATKHLSSVKDVDGKEESGPSEQAEVKNKNRLIKKATLEIRKKLNKWSSETVKDSISDVDVREKGKGVNGDEHDFDHDRREECFEDGQVWAAYDDHDGMPRSYAMIRSVISSDPFKMKVCWLNSKPKDKPGTVSDAFGEFKAGKHEIVTVPNYFSHRANFKKEANGKICVIPRKGDVCALVHRNEIVQVDEYHEGSGVRVTPLVKVAGFKTVFRRHLETRMIAENEISHQIPWRSLLTGCLELDPAALPPSRC